MNGFGRDFERWTCACSLVVSEPSVLEPALEWLEQFLDDVDDRISPWRTDTVLAQAQPTGRVADPDSLTRALVAAAARAQSLTAGAVTPFLGEWGNVASAPRTANLAVPDAGAITWVPGARLDLGASGKAAAADLAAAAIAHRWGGSVLVSLGGDIATAGPESFTVLVQDGDGQPCSTVDLAPGWGLATSSTLHRRWPTAELAGPHILDPWTLRPVPALWRTVSVAAPSCLEANAYATEAMVRGAGAGGVLSAHGRAARLVGQAGDVVHLAGWPSDAEVDPYLEADTSAAGGNTSEVFAQGRWVA